MLRYTLTLIVVAMLLMSCTLKKQNVLHIFNWSDYIDETLIRKFEKQNNCKIVYDTYDSNESMLTKMLTSQFSYDIMVPSSDHVTILADKNLLEPIDKAKLKNYKNLDPAIMQKCLGFDPGNTYSIPYFWGLTGLAYNKKFVPESIIKENSWTILANPLFNDKQKISMPSDSREVIGAALIAAGYSPNETSDEALAKAEQILKSWDANITNYDSEAFQAGIQDGTSWLYLAYIGDALPIMETNTDIGFLLPKEGTTLWIDSIVIPKNAKHKELAYAFIDFMLIPENSKTNADYALYATPNKAAYNLLPEKVKSNPLIYPNPDYLTKCKMVTSVGDDILKLNRIWLQISK